MISREQKNGFTLIELLVVISIISLLSSVVISSVSSARDKARIAAGKQFDSHNFSGFAADALGIWDFEETSGPIVDKSQYLNNLTLINGPTFVSGGGIKGNGRQFNGSNQYALTSKPVIMGNNWTLSAWVKPTVVNTTQTFLSRTVPGLYLLGSGGFRVYIGSATIYNDTVKPTANQWYNVTATYKSVGGITVLYVNGKEVARVTGTSQSSGFDDRCVGVGVGGTHPSSPVGGPCNSPNLSSYPNYFNGIVDEVRIYSNALIASEVHRLYAEGLPRHTLAEADTNNR